MADLKISQLNSIVTVVPATDVLPVVQGGTTLKITPNQILGAGGTATLASATITGDLTVDTSTLKVDSTNNRVGIGTASPATDLHVFKSSATDNALIQLQNGTASSYIGTRGTTYGAVDAGDTYIFNSSGNDIVLMADNAAGTIKFATGGNTESARFNSTGNLAFANGKGIDFSAVTGGTGTATANVLNDYEEGTWTGTLKGSITDPTTTQQATGKYTKIGRQVFVRIQFGNASTVGASGAISVTGLPFTSASGDDQVGYLMVENMATFTNSSLSSYLPPSSSTLSFYSSTSNSVVTQITHNAGVARYLWATITYNV